MSNKPAISGALKILADAGKDVVAAVQPGETLAQKFAAFENLVPDAMAEISEVSDFQAEVASLTPQDGLDLAGELITDCGFTSPHAEAIVASGLKLLADLKTAGVVPDVLAFILAVKNPPAAAPAAPASA